MGRYARRARGTVIVAVTACAALVVTGCAAAASTAHRTGSAAPSAARRATGPAATPRQRAVADAAAILTAFVPPPGARRLAKAPAADGGWLRFPSSTLGSLALVDDASFWTAPGQPPAVLAWEAAHLPRGFTPEDQDFGPPSWDRTFSLAPIPGVLDGRDLVVEVVAAGGGQTAIRVDAQVAWQPPRAPGERVPPAARVVTIAEVPGVLPGSGHPPAPVTITGVAVVTRLAALVDGLQLSTIGPGASCPAPLGPEIRLTFLARPGGSPLAVAQGPADCGTILFTVDGRQQPALELTDTFVSQVLAIAGLHWRLM
jgi:hypothetical protein